MRTRGPSQATFGAFLVAARRQAAGKTNKLIDNCGHWW